MKTAEPFAHVAPVNTGSAEYVVMIGSTALGPPWRGWNQQNALAIAAEINAEHERASRRAAEAKGATR